MVKENKKQYQVSITESNVNKAKMLQLKLAKAENLSGLIDSLIEDWIITAEQLLIYHKEFDKKIIKKKVEGKQSKAVLKDG